MPHPSRTRDLAGQKFNFLTVEKFIGKNKHRMAIWLCRCECGNETILTRGNIVSGNTKSCGCKTAEMRTTHGHKAQSTTGEKGYRGTRTYSCWQAMRARCSNTKHAEYIHYGGRGITVCDAWTDFEVFLADMGEAPDKMSIDRRDNNLGYSKENCRWITNLEQQQNRRNNRLITVNGETKCVSEWARIHKLHKATVLGRLKSGWPIEQIFKK